MDPNCHFCQAKAPTYTCPRCNVAYCGLKCYQSQRHSPCSEAFYKECIETELRTGDGDTDGAKRKTLETLKRQYDESNRNDSDEETLDSDDEDDLVNRLDNVDLDDPDQVWAVLTPEERRDFEKKVVSGEIANILPPEEKQPTLLWWDIYKPKRVVQDVNSTVELHPQCPPPLLTSVECALRSETSTMVKFNILNVVYAYAFSYKHLDWGSSVPRTKYDTLDFVDLCFGISTNLKSGENFSSADMAVESAIAAAVAKSELKASIDFTKDIKKAVFNIVRGPGDGHEDYLYLVAALSGLHSICLAAVKHLKDAVVADKFTVDRKSLKISLKKIQFYSSWVMDNYHEYQL
jgi:hypothetical protein